VAHADVLRQPDDADPVAFQLVQRGVGGVGPGKNDASSTTTISTGSSSRIDRTVSAMRGPSPWQGVRTATRDTGCG
jgi:hypothetical protein